MADAVKIPVSLELTDIQTDKIDFKDLQKSVSDTLSDLTKSANNILKKGSLADLNKTLTSSLNSVENGIDKVTMAQARFNDAMTKAGESSEQYRTEVTKIKGEIESYQASIKAMSPFAGNAVIDKEIAEYTRKIKEAQAKMPDPKDFISSGTESAVTKLVQTYKTLSKAVNSAYSAQDKWNKDVQDNKLTDEYTRADKELDSIVKKIDALSAKYEKMQALGATENAFKSVKYDADLLNTKVKEIAENMTKLVQEGKAFRFSPADISKDVEDATAKYKAQITTVKDLITEQGNLRSQLKDTSGIKANISALSTYMTQLEATRVNLEQQRAAQKKVVDAARKNVKSQVTATGTAKATAEYNNQKQVLIDIQNKIKDIYSKIADTTTKLADANTELQSFNTSNTDTKNKISAIRQQIIAAKAELVKLTNAKTQAESTANTQAVNSLLSQIQSKVSAITPKVEDMSAETKKTSNSVIALANGFSKAFGGIKKHIAGVISSLGKLTKSSRSSSDSMGKNFKRVLKTIMQMSLGVRSLFFLIRKLRSAFISSFQAMATQIPEVNADISSFLTALNQLKGTIATAFQPIASVVIPYLNQLIAALSSAMEALGRFFATLTGQGYIYKFTGKNIDYAATQASKSADKIKKSLMGFDEINRLDDKDSGSSGGGSGPEGTWEKETLDSANKLAEMIKQAWTSGGEFYDVGQYLGEQLLGALQVADDWITTNGYAYAEKIGKSLGTLLTGFVETEGLGTQIGKTIADAFNMAMIGLDTFLTTTNWLSVGQFIADWANASVANFKWDLLGKTVADAITAAVNMWWQFVGAFDFTGLGEKIALAINTFLSTMSISDETGLTVWQKVGESISRTVHGLLTTITTAISQVNWVEVGRGIGQMISSIDWAQIAWDFTKLVGAIVKAIAETFLGWAETSPISAAIAAMIGLAIIGADIAPVISGALPFVEKLGEAFQIVAGGAGTLKEALELAFGVVDTAIGGIALTIGGALLAITNFFSMLTDGFTWLKEIFMVIGIAIAAVGAVILGVPTTVAAVVAGIVAVVATLIVAIKENWNAIVTFIQSAWSAFLTTLSTFCTGVANTVKDILNTIKQTVTNIVNGIKQFISDALTWIKQFVSDIINAISTIVSNIMTTIKNIISTIINAIKSTITSVLNTIKSFWSTTWNTIKTTTNTVFTNIKSVVTNAINTIKNGISTGLNAIKSTWTSIWNSVKSTTTSIFNGMVSAIKGAINSIIGAVNGMIKGIVNGINSAISALNSISFDIPDWIPKIGGMSFGLSIPTISAPSIPYLAQGAVIPPNKEFLAMLGDQKSGTNIEAPLDTIKQAVAEELAEQIDAMMEGFEAVVNAINNKDMTVAIGDKEIGQANARYSRRQNLVRGVSSV